jgi:cobalt-zinc-cadmium efflux system outer membrane protein
MKAVLINQTLRSCINPARATWAFVLLLVLAAHVRPGGAQTTLPVVAEGMTLRAVFDSIGSNSPLLGAANARVRVERGGLTSARAWSNPVVSFESQQMDPVPGTASQRETMTTAMLPLEPLYQRGPRIKRAQALIRATESDVLTQRQQVAADAADVFYQVALAQVNVDATRSLAQWFDTVVTYNSVRVREGVAAEADLIRSRLERDHVLNDLAMAESELARAQAGLQTFVGAGSRIDMLRVDVDSVPLGIAITTSNGRASRPAVEAARQRLVASDAATSTERRLFLHDVGAMVGTKNSAGMSSLVAGFTLPFPLLDQNRGSIAAARAERDVAQLELAQEKRSADADLIGAERAAHILTDRVATFGTGNAGYLGRADEARRIALGAYREGGTSLLQVIDAARAWKEARNSYFETLFAQHLAVIRLLVAEGADVIDTWPKPRSGASQ